MSTSVAAISLALSSQVASSTTLGTSSAPPQSMDGAPTLSIPKKPSPRIVLPARVLAKSKEQAKAAGLIHVITPKSPSRESASNTGREKVGRWTDEEHQVFLEGLEIHGKAWKVIAVMIGTRTVVQVRTHAQKHFQKVDRQINGDGTPAKQQGQTAKRKMSLPISLPSRSNKKPKGNLSKKAQRAASMSIGPSVSPTHEL
jgi:SHAQKYF class myb-like DNA-binding protein